MAPADRRRRVFGANVVTATQNVVTGHSVERIGRIRGCCPTSSNSSEASRDPQPAPNLLEGANDGNYWYNAGRDPWRLGVDAILNDDPVTLAQVQKISNWARTSTGGNPNNIRGGYKLDGTPLNIWQDIFYIAAGRGRDDGEGAVDQQWLNSLYNRVYQSHNTGDYYGDAVTLQSLLAVTGNLRDPAAVWQAPRVAGRFQAATAEVDGDDLSSRWQTNFGVGNQADAVTAMAIAADGADFLVWQRNYRPAGELHQRRQRPFRSPLSPRFWCSDSRRLVGIDAGPAPLRRTGHHTGERRPAWRHPRRSRGTTCSMAQRLRRHPQPGNRPLSSSASGASFQTPPSTDAEHPPPSAPQGTCRQSPSSPQNASDSRIVTR